VVLISVAGSGGAGRELALALGLGLPLALGLGEVALDPELVPLLGDQLGDGGDVGGHLEGAAEGLGEGRQLAARGAVVRTRAVTRRTTVLLLRLRHQIQQERRTESGYTLMPPLLVEECLTVVRNGEQLEVLREAEALALLQAEPAGNVQGPQRQMELERAAQAEEDHRTVRKAAVGSGGALLMRFRCEPSLPVDGIGLFVLLPAPQLWTPFLPARHAVYTAMYTQGARGVEAIPSRVFMNGNSQAVRIPAEFRLSTDRVQISRTADGDLLIHPCPTHRGQALLKTLAGFDPDFVASLESQQAQKLPMQERELL
jgi:antitoxin VapB